MTIDPFFLPRMFPVANPPEPDLNCHLKSMAQLEPLAQGQRHKGIILTLDKSRARKLPNAALSALRPFKNARKRRHANVMDTRPAAPRRRPASPLN